MLNFKTSVYVAALFLVVLSFIAKDARAVCTYTINGPTTLIKGSGEDVSFEVTTQSGCSWLARNIFNWSIATGTGSGTFIYHVPENKDSNPKVGIMQVTDNNSGANFRYYQAGCADVTFNPTTMSFGPDGGTDTVDFTVKSTVQGCDMTGFFPQPYGDDFLTYDPTEYKSGKVTLSVYPYTVASFRTGGFRLPRYGDGEGEVPTALSPKLTLTQTGSPSAKDDCAATLSSSLLLHSPIIIWNVDADNNPATYGGNVYYFSADFQYDPSFSLTDYVFNLKNITGLGILTYGGSLFSTTYTGWTGYKNYVCQQSYLALDANNNYKLHIYEIILNNASYWLEFTYLPTTDGQTRFKLTDFRLNH